MGRRHTAHQAAQKPAPVWLGQGSHVALRAESALEDDGPRLARAPTLLFTLEGSVAKVSCAGQEFRVDRAHFALLPPGVRYRLSRVSVVTQVMTLEYGEVTLATVVESYSPYIEADAWRRLCTTPALLPRTRWVDELAHRYRFERAVCLKHESIASRFLETELMKEAYFVARSAEKEAARVSVLHQGSTVLEQARALIESSLDKPLSVRDLATRCHVSESSLLRAFATELGVTPSDYTRARRLDHALALLESKRLSVSEVAHRTGYASAAAFSVAFKKRFGCSPSDADASQLETRVSHS